ncbi:hypothetical protein A2533_00640 [Candidatus Falkowbacteria bacterium RIFOXYD2_FULL_35_9]|uniref:NYN domain-containing protein n=1 Tax=Candidatus Falkowbacteria bacterium RIFOXYC2_FULL_36_12 TaxID=1798002 RepID=A0A1F5T0I1_9BACT|nr:MAG: hypothetical protein A2300_00010 [Candidatus Falkowbacteria bacterium RIFOXYB2_FULL_35_7]OGF32422.1 MAG: hypothetical protein A2478_03825 [Candidatus Falkowbacteria bacterium RIFOXYC2_FULL_36_12]OGF33869.1 MAG: hypothetical protein A2223_03060 [Candidatus Falkowbacteria bacterium RIFOXYA2_FULL_35_8]OGF46771.1 MAG: hypothetical protein A2533_00640 [Candidatus Falkowbacteria bacterium RIFOXYD2_FULL_35_9]
MFEFKEQRLGMLIDIQNLYYSAKVLHKKKVSFTNVLKEAVGDRKLIRAVAYGIRTAEKHEENFLNSLELAGFEVKTKDLQVFPDGTRKGDWDVGIAVDAIKLAQSLDVIVIASGDGDFLPLVEYLQVTYGCRVEVIAFVESANAALMEKVDKFTNMSKNKRKFLI